MQPLSQLQFGSDLCRIDHKNHGQKDNSQTEWLCEDRVMPQQYKGHEPLM